MRNAAILLVLGVLGVLLSGEGVASLQCYSCHDCAVPGPYEITKTCYTSCYASVICKGNGQVFSSRLCSKSNEEPGCRPSLSSENTYNCFCNDDRCDPLELFPDVCDSAPAATLVSFTYLTALLLLAALLPSVLA
ncbi:uncharacterized protein LOC123505604 isoform X1 [Portunus trituberculatus]|uniref:uncharacterized protein LOC123505604 isoform X1 n=1 Tax=Portunus trituberculatus TaxID=210409 RepID=UPI001E1CD4F6|nr:uncharacterized protein LOC123505604 isoform X1 [Portunus trituberculatus]XP_045113067.1 uncharacterized protein LOC123505604 isoform X1 [Portunus trituberculatus]